MPGLQIHESKLTESRVSRSSPSGMAGKRYRDLAAGVSRLTWLECRVGPMKANDAIPNGLETFQLRELELAAAHQHLAVFGAALRGGDDLAGVEQALGVESALDAKHLLVFFG